MKRTVQFNCINKDCGAKLIGPEHLMDGIRCTECDDIVVPVPYDPTAEHIHYKHKHQRQCQHLYREFRVETINREVTKIYFYCQKCLDIQIKSL